MTPSTLARALAPRSASSRRSAGADAYSRKVCAEIVRVVGVDTVLAARIVSAHQGLVDADFRHDSEPYSSARAVLQSVLVAFDSP